MRLNRTLAVVLAALLAVFAVVAASTALGRSTDGRQQAHTSSAAREVGIGDEDPTMFASPQYRALHLKIARYFLPYDIASGNDPSGLATFTGWLYAALQSGVQPLVAFYHNESSPEKMPSVATYTKDVKAFLTMFPQVTVLTPWNEVNRGDVRAPGDNYDSPTPEQSAQYYLALKKLCPTCTIVGLDVLDSTDPYATIAYINDFKADVGRKNMPKIWGLHNYSETNRFEDNGTKEILDDIPGQLWLTETGGLAEFKPSFPFNLKRQANATKYMFALADSSSRITRLYIYSWFGGAAPNGGFDAGLTNAKGKPRPAYCVVYEHIRGKKRCPYKTVKN